MDFLLDKLLILVGAIIILGISVAIFGADKQTKGGMPHFIWGFFGIALLLALIFDR